MKIIIDAMGGDNAPQAQIEGAVNAMKDMGVDIIFVGKESVVKKELEKYEYPKDRVTIVNADDVITNHEEPAKAVRSKKNSSIVVAANLLKNGEADALLAFNLGNTALWYR